MMTLAVLIGVSLISLVLVRMAVSWWITRGFERAAKADLKEWD